MSQGLDAAKELVLVWRWLPTPPLPLDQALPTTAFASDELFRLDDTADDAEREAFRFSFPQLARQTPDPRFYRLIQIFNTPLLTMTTRDAGRSSYAYWRGKAQLIKEDHRYAYFWFFTDQTDGDLVALEYGFSGGLVLRSATKSQQQLKKTYGKICERVREGRTIAMSGACDTE